MHILRETLYSVAGYKMRILPATQSFDRGVLFFLPSNYCVSSAEPMLGYKDKKADTVFSIFSRAGLEEVTRVCVWGGDGPSSYHLKHYQSPTWRLCEAGGQQPSFLIRLQGRSPCLSSGDAPNTLLCSLQLRGGGFLCTSSQVVTSRRCNSCLLGSGLFLVWSSLTLLSHAHQVEHSRRQAQKVTGISQS